jgi:hypothetical protein
MDDSCVAWTIGYGLLSFLNEFPNEPLNPYYVYRWSLWHYGNFMERTRWEDSGCDFNSGFSAISTQGSCQFDAFKGTKTPPDFYIFDTVTQAVASDAKKNSFSITPQLLRTRGLVNSLKQELAAGKVLPCGFYIHEGLREGVGLVDCGKGPRPSLWKTSRGGTIRHAMLVVGYDDDLQAFEVMNSFGPDFADNGFVWIDYRLFADQGQDLGDTSDNPCCIVAYTYQLGYAPSEMEAEIRYFEEGKAEGWVRLRDQYREFNFRTTNSSPITKVGDLSVDDKIVALSKMIVRKDVVASAGRVSSSGSRIGALEIGDSVIVKDVRQLSYDGGRRKEYWIKVIKSL